MVSRTADRWNLNVHYHSAIHRAIPPGATTAVDIGCGQGVLAFELASRGLRVLGIDVDAASVERAQADPLVTDQTTFEHADLFDFDFVDQSFDLVASVAALHHVDERAALRRMKRLVRPGGTLAVVGFARPSRPADIALKLAGVALKRVQILRGRYWEHDAPICWPPPMTMNEMAALAAAELPGCTFHRAMSYRYTLVWHAT